MNSAAAILAVFSSIERGTAVAEGLKGNSRGLVRTGSFEEFQMMAGEVVSPRSRHPEQEVLRGEQADATCGDVQRRLEEAEAANRRKDEFLAIVAHELRTPLNAVLGWARLLESHQLPPDRTDHAVAAIARSSSALASIVDDLLDTSRILNGSIRAAQEPVDIVAVAQSAIDDVRPSAAMKNVQLSFDSNPKRRTVIGDAGRLEQVIWNLLANAIKFTPEGGRVTVHVESSSDDLELRVVDTGQGISADLLPHVFEGYRQAEGATTARHTGLGLGLGIVLRLVELHGGTAQAASAGLGRGATFTVRLPLAARGDAGIAR